MHNNFYYLRQVTTHLEARLEGAVASECFSQNKDELILRFETRAKSFYIRASLSPVVSCLSFPGNFERARKNSVDLMPSIIGTRVLGLRQFTNERSFAILLSDRQMLLFKMHGNRTNIILLTDNRASDVFRKNLAADFAIDPDHLDREIDWSREFFLNHVDELRATYFTFGKVVWQYLEDRGFSSLTPDEKWKEIQQLLAQLERPDYYITIINGKPTFSLLTLGDIQTVVHDPLEAANEYYRYFTQQHVFLREKNQLLSVLKGKLEAGENYHKKNSDRLEELLRDNQYKVWADVIMANLHAIDPSADRVVLENFYDNQLPVEIRMRKDSTPQKTAETYYRKAKNRHIEIGRLEQSIKQKEDEIAGVRAQIEEVESASDLKGIRAIKSRISPPRGEKDRESLPYHEFTFRDFRILVGKNARANDVLTMTHGYKDDLWLHAKDVSGSHVLIKYQAGKPFPKDVIGYAASLAALNSKRKNESLCPVIVTPRKYVRKRKGDPPGAVVVEREEVILVAPAQL